MSADHQHQQPPRVTIRVRKRPAQPAAEAPPPAPDETDAPSEGPAADEAPYRVGYKCPPKHSQFKAGQGAGGNRKGRPKGSRNWATIMAEAAGRKRTIGIGGETVRMCGREAVAEQLVISAIKGDPKARRDFLNEMRHERTAAPPESAPSTAPEPLSASDEALLEDFFNRASKPPSEEDEP